MKRASLRAQIEEDAQAALDYYGGTLDILRPSLKRRVQVQHVRLVYQGGILLPENMRDLKGAMNQVQAKVEGVEVLVQ